MPWSMVGVTLTISATAGVYSWLQVNPAMSALDRLAEITPLVAVLLVGMWILFAAYRGLVDRLVQVVETNTKATTESTSVMRDISAKLGQHEERLERLEDDHHRGHQGGPTV